MLLKLYVSVWLCVASVCVLHFNPMIKRWLLADHAVYTQLQCSTTATLQRCRAMQALVHVRMQPQPHPAAAYLGGHAAVPQDLPQQWRSPSPVQSRRVDEHGQKNPATLCKFMHLVCGFLGAACKQYQAIIAVGEEHHECLNISF